MRGILRPTAWIATILLLLIVCGVWGVSLLLAAGRRDDGGAIQQQAIGVLAGSVALAALSIALAVIHHREHRRGAAIEKALRESEEKLRAVVESMPGFVFTLTPDGTVTYANRALPDLTPADVVGTSIFDHFAPQYRETARKALERAVRTRAVVSYEAPGTGPTGAASLYESYVGPILRDGRVVALTLIANDVTERKALERELLEARSREQRRIAQELHDGLGQNLTGIALMLKGLERNLRAVAPERADEVALLTGLVNKTISHAQAQALSRGLSPVDLDQGGLPFALEKLASHTAELHRVSCRYEGDSDFPLADEAMASHLYRIAEEAVTNAVKHGEPRHIVLRMTVADGGIRLVIRDDGAGLPPGRDPVALDSEGKGLRVMGYRAERIGGTIEVRPDPLGGTRVVCWCPLP